MREKMYSEEGKLVMIFINSFNAVHAFTTFQMEVIQ